MRGRSVNAHGDALIICDGAETVSYTHLDVYKRQPEGVLIDIEEINQYPPEKIVLVTTGSQGEPLSALSRMSSASHRNVRVGEGDFIIISANPIPGNEKMVTKVINGLLRLGAEVIYESMYDCLLYTSRCV